MLYFGFHTFKGQSVCLFFNMRPKYCPEMSVTYTVQHSKGTKVSNIFDVCLEHEGEHSKSRVRQ